MISKRCAKRFCNDDISKIENYEQAMNDTSNTWDLHHRNELTLDGEFALSRADLIRMDMYYNRPYFELIFLTPSEHMKLHSKSRTHERSPRHGKTHSDETRQKMAELHKGKSGPNKGRTFSDEHRQKMREAWARRKAQEK